MKRAQHAEVATMPRRFKPYPAYKDSGLEWLGEIPAHWKVKRVRNVVGRIEQGWSPDCENREADDDEWGVLKAGCVNRGVFDEAEHKALPRDLSPVPELEVHEGDLLMSRASGSRDLVGSVAVVPRCRPRLLLCDKVFRLHVAPDAGHKPFLAYAMNSRTARWQIEVVLSGGSGLANNIAQEVVKDLVLVSPTIEEQRAIAAFLDRETGRIGGLVAKKERLIELLQEQRTALITRAVTKGLDPNVPLKDSGVEWPTEIPANWETRPLTKYVIDKADYRGKTPAKVTSGVFLVTAKNVRMGWIDYECSQEFVAEDDYSEIMRRGFPKTGDILFTTEAPLGNVALVNREDIALAQRIIRFRMNANYFHSRFTLYAMMSDYFQSQLVSLSTGSTAEGLKASKLPMLWLVAPSVIDQRTIAAFLDRETARIDALIAKVRKAIDRLKELRTALISAAVTGKIDVRTAFAEVSPSQDGVA